ncbi:MAG: hypothetical protein JWP57_2314 [Spirosoma sp.]|nr:hypothetical protein [Spirosoma sp.]
MEIFIRFLNLLIAALVTGSVFGIWVSFNPLSLSSSSYVEQHQSLVKAFNLLLPLLGGIVILSSLGLAYINKGNKSVMALFLITAGFFILTGLITRFGNQPINALVMTWKSTNPPSDWTEWRDKWWLYHKLRFLTSIVGLCLLIWVNLQHLVIGKNA